MKIMYYGLAIASGVLGFSALFRISESYLAGQGINLVMIAFAALGLGLARFWSKQAKALK